MPAATLKPNHKAIQAYYAALETYKEHHVKHEGALETAFSRLLADTGFRPLSVSYRVTALFPVAAARRLLTRGRAETDVGSVSPPLNTILTGIMRLENRTLTRVRLPFGLSVFAVATPAERIR